MDDAHPSARRAHWLIGPLVTLAAVVLLLIAARHVDRFPVDPPRCGFKDAFGIPCVGCGGTRAMRALASGDAAGALRFNPGAVAGVVLCGIWMISGSLRFFSGTPVPPPAVQNRRLKRNAAIALVLLVLNWIYLIRFLP